ncbi:MAG: hypothetical protein AAGH19_07365 [Pseudomonadota bacterium]
MTMNHRSAAPKLSIVLVVHAMAEQAINTIRSLDSAYQAGIHEDDYEVLIMENPSEHLLPEDAVEALPDQMRYVLREDARPTPVYAINEGIEMSRGHNICVMIDGARLVTPGVLRNLLLGHGLSERAIVTVPGYHLGEELQQTAVAKGYSTAVERALMESIAWPEDGYRLFDIACFSGASAGGFFRPHWESNCISMPRALWTRLGGFDEHFDLPGGGLVNLDTYRRACELEDTLLVLLLGEGTFHQFHGGVTTGGVVASQRDDYLARSHEQYEALRGQRFKSPQREKVYFGALPHAVRRYLSQSVAKAGWARQPRAESGA